MFRHVSALRTAALGFALSLAAIAPALAAQPPAGTPTFAAAPVVAASFDTGMLHVDSYGHGAQSIVLIPGPVVVVRNDRPPACG
jgi:hypothetical protein